MPYLPISLFMLLCIGCVDDANTIQNESPVSDASSGADGGTQSPPDDAMDVATTDGAPRTADADIANGPDLEVIEFDAAAQTHDADLMLDVAFDPSSGSTPVSCGAESQGLRPVDCTSAGDQDAQCVFSNHCMCSEGFECQAETMWPGTRECDPGSICVPAEPVRVGSDPSSCGAEQQGLTPVDCTAGGDENAFCVFSNHCACSEGYVCEISEAPGECEPGEGCRPADQP